MYINVIYVVGASTEWIANPLPLRSPLLLFCLVSLDTLRVRRAAQANIRWCFILLEARCLRGTAGRWSVALSWRSGPSALRVESSWCVQRGLHSVGCCCWGRGVARLVCSSWGFCGRRWEAEGMRTELF
ncbi:hypothetical protein TcCL_ESM11460 [Trypanosoma cruzi]|nr:hypothetical protein TcCL_ESM11460 [Trypanosoma cruzi]